MGKSTLAQLVYNDAKISGDFNSRYWACISDIFDEKEILGKINQSIKGECEELTLDQLQSSIRMSIQENGRFLLVLDDLWDENMSKGSKLLSILSSDRAKGSKIIVTTRHLSVATAMSADKVLEVQGLSDDASWALFRRYAFTKDQANDPTWISVGEKIAKKCSNVPLAIKSIASLLRVKNTIGEWRSLENEQLSKIQFSDDSIMSTLRLSYDHLPSYLKNCFAYCSLIPKSCTINIKTLVYLWIAQGYITSKEGETLEMAGNACFMDLFRRSFFQEAEYDDGEVEIKRCKMHDLVHDLAEDVAGEESCIIPTKRKDQTYNKIRHLCLDYDNRPSNTDDNPLLLLNAGRLRSSLYTPYSCRPELLDEQFMNFKFLRALSLQSQGIDDVPSSIGEMKYLRYLDLSSNRKLTHLPDSITKLVNLITLDISFCEKLVRLPKDIGELISLRHLINSACLNLHYMPATFEKLTSLEHLSEFMVTTNGVVIDGEFCMLNALGRLNLRGRLMISFDKRVEWSRDKELFERGHVPDSLEALQVEYYPSMRMPAWWTDIKPALRLPKLERLFIHNSDHVRNLAPLRCLPCLRSLSLYDLPSLEFIEDDEVVLTTPFFPSLCTLVLAEMGNLKGWSRPTNALMFPCLSRLEILRCPQLSYWPVNAPRLKSMKLYFIKGALFEQLVSGPFASSIEKIEILDCKDLSTILAEGLTSLRILRIVYCWSLIEVRVAPNTVEEFAIHDCVNMELWDDETSVDWLSFANLSLLTLGIWEQEYIRLPDCLQQLVILGKLCVKYRKPGWSSCSEGGDEGDQT